MVRDHLAWKPEIFTEGLYMDAFTVLWLLELGRAHPAFPEPNRHGWGKSPDCPVRTRAGSEASRTYKSKQTPRRESPNSRRWSQDPRAGCVTAAHTSPPTGRGSHCAPTCDGIDVWGRPCSGGGQGGVRNQVGQWFAEGGARTRSIMCWRRCPQAPPGLLNRTEALRWVEPSGF